MKDEKGFYVEDEDGTKVYLKEDKEKYIEIMKRQGKNRVIDERMSSEAKHILWKNTDYKSFR